VRLLREPLRGVELAPFPIRKGSNLRFQPLATVRVRQRALLSKKYLQID
jgi:hypothetical protein